MAIVQSTYQERVDDAFAGMVGSMTTCTIDSYEVATGQDIAYGRAVMRNGTDVNTIDQGAEGTATALTNFLGVAVATGSRLADVSSNTSLSHYDAGNIAAVLSRGDVWVQVDGAVAVGNDVTVTDATGELGTTAADGDHSPVAGIWLTAAADNGLAKVRLFGTIA